MQHQKQIACILFACIILTHNIITSVEHTSHQLMPTSSSWSDFAAGKKMRPKELLNNFVGDCIAHASENEKIPHHTPNSDIMRIATYNIHFWRPPYDNIHSDFDFAKNDNFDAVIQTIKNINADVLILQEVIIFDWMKIKTTLESLGYVCTLSMFVQTSTYNSYPFGNMIITKQQSKNAHTIKMYDVEPEVWPELHGFIRTHINLPNKKKAVVSDIALPNHKKITIYGTHLDVYDHKEDMRAKQVQELIDHALKEDELCIVAADFNAIRARDYQYAVQGKNVWDLLNEDHRDLRGFDAPTKALDLFTSHGFVDCFSKAQLECPKFSVWNGTLVDFIWLNPTWDLPIVGCYIYYSIASDHLPIIMDIKINNED